MLLSTYYPSTTSDGTTGGTLRAAIITANAHSGADTIVLGSSTYRLTIANDPNNNHGIEDGCLRGDLDNTDTLTIQGAGRDATIIDAQGIDRVFHNFSYLCLRDLTITGGLTKSSYEVGGGGILGNGELVLVNCQVTANTAKNSSSYSLRGGGIYTSGPLTLTNAIVSDNAANRNGGGIYSTYTSNLRTNSITDSTISGNQGAEGGGLYAQGGTWSISNSTFSSNNGQVMAPGCRGGAIWNYGTLSVTNSTFSGNEAGYGGGIYNVGTGTVTGCTFTGNTALGGEGGGAYNDGTGTMTMLNCTFSGNTALFGGGVCAWGGVTTVVNCTVSGNSASYGGGISSTGQYGHYGTVNLKNTIVAGNTASSGGPDVNSNYFISQGNNFIGKSDGSTGFTNGVNGDQVGSVANPIDPGLGPLQNNGGSTQTMALLDGSPAIDAGNNTGAPATDQRGFARILDGNKDGTATIDIGAYEYATVMNDFNGDGISDVLWHNKSDGTVGVWITMNEGFGRWVTLGGAPPAVWKSAGFGDVDGDGTADVVWHNQSDGMVGAWIIKNEKFDHWVTISTVNPTVWKLGSFGDFDGDGTADMLWHNQSDGTVGIWFVKNAQFDHWAILGSAPSVWRATGFGDVNGDGTVDVLWHNQSASDGTVGAWIIKNGMFDHWVTICPVNPTVWKLAGVGDYDGDGTADLLWHNQSNGTLGIWFIKNAALSRWVTMGVINPAAWRTGGGALPLQATSVATLSATGALSLTQSDLRPIVNEAIARWKNAGLDAATLARLSQVQFVISDLPGSYLGEADGNRIYIDANAAGHGWFVDSTPASDEEFASSLSNRLLRAVDPRAVDRIDLLTVVEHELGHIAGLDDLDALASDIMSGVLGNGVRRNPYWRNN